MKKFITLLLLSLFLLVPWTDIGAQSAIFLEEDFDNSSSLPVGWTKSGTTTTASYNWSIFTGTTANPAFSSPRCIRANSYSNPVGKTSIIMSPLISITNPDTKLSFYVKNPTGGKLAVYISTDSGQTYQQNLLDSNLVNITDWTKKTYSLSSYFGNNIKLVFEATSNKLTDAGAYQYLDNIKVYETPTCAQPIDLTISSISQTSAKLSWNLDSEGDVPTQYLITIQDDNGNYFYQNQAITINTYKEYVINGLSPATTYHVNLKSDCSANSRGYSNLSSTVSFTTFCNAATLPQSFDFESEVAGDVPSCFTIVAPTSASAVNSTKFNGTESAGNSLSLVSTVDAQALATTIPLAHNANDIQVDLYANTTSDGVILTMGLLSDPFDFSTFEPLYTCNLTKNNWENIRFNTYASQQGTQQNLMVGFVVSSGAASTVYLDDIIITSIPSCPRLEDVTIDVADSTFLEVSWLENVPSNNYQVEVSIADSIVSYYNVTSNPCVISGLIPQTSYSLRVRSICSSNDTSEWSLVTTGTTICGASPVPFFENFDASTSLPDCWSTYCSREGTVGSGSVSSGWSINSTVAASAISGYSLISPDSKAGTKYMLHFPTLYIPNGETYELEFWMYRGTTYATKEEKIKIYVNNKPNLNGAILLDSIHRVPTMYPIEGNVSAFYEYFYDIPLTGNVYIMFESYHEYGAAIFIDDVVVGPEKSCRTGMKNVRVDFDENTNDATINWMSKTDETQWLVNISVTNVSMDSVMYSGSHVANDSNYVFNCAPYILSSSDYIISATVYGLCGNDTTEGSATGSTSFTTPCGTLWVPYTQSFENTLFPPNCWSTLTDSLSAAPANMWKRTTSYKNNGVASAYFADSKATTIGYLSTGAFNFEAGKRYVVSYYQRRFAYSSIKYKEGITVWVSTTPNDTTNATKLGFVPRQTTLEPVVATSGLFYPYDYVFSVPTTGQYYVIFQATQEFGSANYIDDVTITEAPSCLDILSSSIDVNSNYADKVVIDIKDSTIVQLGVAICSENKMSMETIDPTDVIVMPLVDSTYKVVINNLSPSTTYNLFFRNVCDSANNVMTDWTDEPLTISTICEPVEVSGDSLIFFDGFEDYGTLAQLDNENTCYSVTNSTTSYKTYIKGGVGSSYSSTGTQCMPYAGEKQLIIPYANTATVIRNLYLRAGVNYQISIYSRQSLDTYVDKTALHFFYRHESSDSSVVMIAENIDDNSGEWTQYKAYFSVATDGVYFIGFQDEHKSSITYIAFDNFCVREVNCIPPVHTEILSVTSNSISVVSTGETEQKEVRICSTRPSGEDVNPTAVVIDTISENNFTLTGLQSNSTYYLIVRSVCDNGGSSDWSMPIEFTTNCEAYDIPYEVTFNSVLDTRCWKKSGSETSIVEFSNTRSVSSPGSIKIKGATAISPELNVTSLVGMMITGWVYADQDSASAFSIGVCVDPNDVGSFETISEVAVTTNNDWVEFTAYFDNLNSEDFVDFVNSRYVTINCLSENIYYFDNISIYPVPSCPKPTDAINTIVSSEEVNLQWNAGGTETSWHAELYKIVDNEYYLVSDTVVDTTSINFVGLEPLNYYQCQVASICSATDTSAYTYSNTIKTPCAPLPLPYFSNFGSTMPDCWNTVDVTNNSTRKWTYYTSGYFSTYLPTGASTDTTFLNTPEFKLKTSNGVQIALTGYKSVSTDSVFTYVRYTTDGGLTYDSLPASFISYGTSTNKPTVKATIPNVGPGMIQFQFISEEHKTGYIYIYGLKVEEIDNCARPEEVTFNVVNDTVIATIVDNDSTHTQWDYILSTADFDPSTRTPLTTNSKTIVLTDLSPSSTYYMYVRSNCGSEVSSWYTPYSFYTPCNGIASLPYSQNFDNLTTKADILDNCYTFYSTNADNPRGQLTTYPKIQSIESGTKYTMNGSKAIKMATCTTNTLFLYLPEVELPVTELNVAFNYINEGETSSNGNIVVGVMLPDNANSFVSVYTCPLDKDDIDKNRVNVSLRDALPAGDYSGYRVAFKYGPGGSVNMWASIDNILVYAGEKCSYAPELSFSNIIKDSVFCSISYNADSIQVAYGPNGVDVENYTNIINNASRTEIVAGLTSSTLYDFYVRQFCNNVASEWYGPFTVATECDTVFVDEDTPWVENFDNVDEEYQFPMCMHRISTFSYNNSLYPQVVDSTVITSPSALCMRKQNIIGLPLFESTPDNYRLSFYVYGTGSIEIGSIDGLRINTFNPVTTVNAPNSVTKVDIDLSLYAFDYHRLALRSDVNAMLYIDSLTVYQKPTCFEPRRLQVVEVSDIDATIEFALSSIAEGFEYYVASATDTITAVVDSFATQVHLDSLKAYTNYQFGIRSFCTDNDTSDWSTISFKTNRAVFRGSFVIDFEDNAFNNAYLTFINDSRNKFIIGTNANAVKDGNKALYISRDNSSYRYDSSMTQVSYVVSKVEFKPGQYEFSFDFKGYGESNYDYMRVFLAPEDMEFTANVLKTGLSYSSIPDGCVAIDGGKLNLQNDWINKSISVVADSTVTMQLVFVWRNDGSGGKQPPASIDNFTCTLYPCNSYLDSISALSILNNRATFRIVPAEDLSDTIVYTLYSGAGVELITDTVDIASLGYLLNLTGLNENNEYLLKTYGFCNEGKTISSSYAFETTCTPISVSATRPYVQDFESATTTVFADNFPCIKDITFNGTYKFTLTSGTSTTVGMMPYEGSRGVYLYYYGKNRKMMYNVFDLDSGYCEISSYAVSKGGLGIIRYYYRAMGEESWTLLKEFNTSESYEVKAAPLYVPQDGYYYIGVEYDCTNMTAGYMCMDLFSIRYTNLFIPSSLTISNVGTTTADAQWSSLSTTNRLKVYDKGSNEVVFDSLVANGNSLTITGLNPSTDYIASICAESGVNVSAEVKTSFSTPCGVITTLYENNFDNYADYTRPNCWVLDAHLANGNEYEMSATIAQWEVRTYENHRALYMTNASATKYSVNVVYSPEIQLNSSAVLKFDYFNNITNSAYADSLVVTIISNNVESAPILIATYADMDDDYWGSFVYDLSSYVGSTIKVKFWSRSSWYSSSKFVAIDNFKISCQTPGDVYYASVCPNTTYRGNGFSVEPSEVVMGDTTTITRVATGRNGQCDTLITLHLYVPSPSATIIYDTICEGEVYNKNGFNDLTVANRYVQNFTSSLGCDSNVVLYLAVADVNNYYTVNLCEGQTYNFAGQTITAAGVYTDSTINSRGCDSVTVLTVTYTPKYYEETAYFCEGTSYTWLKTGTVYNAAGRYENRLTNAYGCDSIQVLNLVMLPTNVYETLELCEGQNYDFFGTAITEAGTYTHSMINTLGCDSIITLTVTTTPAPFTQVSDYVCEGQEYYGYGFTLNDIVSDTVVTRTVKTTEGCDSIVELTLDFIPTVRVAITATINEGETYEFGGNSLSQAGEYEHTFHTALGCDSVVTLTLNVTTPVDNAYALPIIVAPNPVYGGQSTFVNREWTAAEQSGMRVEVLNSVGQVVEVFTPTSFPIEVGGIYTSGVYYIRVTTGTGDIYLGRLVVR